MTLGWGISQTATEGHGFIPFLARKLCLVGESQGKYQVWLYFGELKSSSMSSRMLRNIVPYLQSAPPHDPKGSSSHSFIQHPLLALFLLADMKTIQQECEPQNVQYRNCSDNSPGVSSGRHSLVGRRHHLCRLDSYSCLLPRSIASPRQRSGEIRLISPLSVTVASTIASSTPFCAALSANSNYFRARSTSTSEVVSSKSRKLKAPQVNP